jgi:pyridoxal phosphate enzyme (YggS family)
MGAYDFVAGNVAGIRERLAAAALRSGRKSEDVSLMAVTKFHPVEAVEEAYGAGLRLFGENRVQEAEGKFPAFLAAHPDARLDLIGSLQSNKAKKALALFSRVESVDSLELLKELNKRALAAPRRLEILLELHTGEDSKAGFENLDSLLAAAEYLSGLESSHSGGLTLRGLMTMAPFTTDQPSVRASFRALRAAFEAVKARFAFSAFDTLSMGMTNDFEIAVEEGSTLVRIGTAIFGSRDRP